jgi:hypothetical protein
MSRRGHDKDPGGVTDQPAHASTSTQYAMRTRLAMTYYRKEGELMIFGKIHCQFIYFLVSTVKYATAIVHLRYPSSTTPL